MNKIISMGLLAGILTLFGFENCSTPRNPSFEEQLKVFKELGFDLNNGIDVSDIKRWDIQEFIDEPFSLMYETLGQELEREPWTAITNRCWHFDTEAIEDHGSYIEIIKNLERITRGELVFTNVTDYVDIMESKASVAFNFQGVDYKWDLKVDDDWVDASLFSKVVELAKNSGSKGRFTYFDTGGQSATLGFETPKSLKEIKKRTGLKIQWLD